MPSLREEISPASLILLIAALVLDESSPNSPSGKGDLASSLATLERATLATLAAHRQRLAEQTLRLDRAAAARLEATRAAHATRAAKLAALSPYAVLARGYAIATDAAGRTLTDPAQTHPGAPLTLTLARGTLPVHAD